MKKKSNIAPYRDPRLKSLKRTACPEGIKGVLGNALRRFGLDQEIARYSFVNHWREIVGEEIARLKDMSTEEVYTLTTRNAQTVFRNIV